jgi:hypothetical protein
MLRYFEKVLPSPYGPRLPWWFPVSRSYWLSGDVEEGLPALNSLGQVFRSAFRPKRGAGSALGYQQVCLEIPCISSCMQVSMMSCSCLLISGYEVPYFECR